MDARPDQPERVTYTLLEDGVHRLTLHDSSIEAVHEALALLADVMADQPLGQPCLLILDYRTGGEPPMSALSLLRDFYTKHPPTGPILSAYLVRRSGLTQLFQSILSTIRVTVSRRFFDGPDAEADALAWLMDERDRLIPPRDL